MHGRVREADWSGSEGYLKVYKLLYFLVILARRSGFSLAYLSAMDLMGDASARPRTEDLLHLYK